VHQPDALDSLQAALQTMQTEHDSVVRENLELHVKLAGMELALLAVRSGEVDAVLLPGHSAGDRAGAGGRRLFALDGADRHYRLLIEEMGEGALTLARDGVITYANRRFADMLQRPLGQVIGSRIAACLTPESQPALAALLEEGRRGKRSAALELLNSAGLRMPILLTANRLVVDGVPDALCMVATDLTGQRRGEVAIQTRQMLLKMVEDQGRTEESLRVSLETLRLHDSALGAISQGVLITDRQGNATYANPACAAITGYSTAEMTGRSPSFLQGPGTDAAVLQVLRTAIAAARPFQGELLNYRRDGTPFWNELSVIPVFVELGAPSQFVGVMCDVTPRRQADAQLLLAAKVFEQSGEGLYIADPRHIIVKVNHAFCTISGYSAADAVGQGPELFQSDRHEQAFYSAIWEQTDAAGGWQGEVWNRRKDGSVYPQWLSTSRVTDAEGRTTHFIASFSDITQRKEAEDRIRRLAHYDPLTGLPNRTLLGERATHALQMAQRKREPLALMFIDLDHFKNINDSLGHAVGDALLVALAARFKSTLREQDTLSRTGGDEFVLLLPASDANGAAHVAQKLLLLAAEPYRIAQHDLTITPSIGIALYPADGDDYSALAQSADAAMYRAKQEGRNRACFHTAEIQAQAARMLLLENGLRRALERGQLSLHYQPQLSLQGDSIIGAEALLRWQHPELGAVAPAEFIPVAESSGLITAIGEWVLKTALQQMRAWMDGGMAAITMAVNLSAVQFRQKNLPALVARLLEETGIAAPQLELELTESVASDDPAAAMLVMNELHARGVRMSIDDFGTGYSSLSYLKRFRISKLKIDRSFVGGVSESAEDQAIVTAIISLARSLGMRTVAEGVETQSQLDYLRGQGCDEIQGYLFSRPLGAAQFEAFFRGHAGRAGAGAAGPRGCMPGPQALADSAPV
jgi:diguanylate cyclase (GGDEF)-like protein/PAS domain S-box-containing protein